ncbi:cyclophilin-like fold protein [Pseudoramibacter alactolyticus]|uniref:cyclophilin-like fold protein n=1 Tax=Pseudoramibacter alactolyticus TaxID=113287 RepID=UPI0028EBB63A|nr:cyclophilin-like fold protein [Pseudoramibacter alactolyticus]
MTTITIKAGRITLRAALGDSAAAREFARRQPFTVTMRDEPARLAGRVPRGRFDPGGCCRSPKRGDLVLGGGALYLYREDAPPEPGFCRLQRIGRVTAETLAQLDALGAGAFTFARA